MLKTYDIYEIAENEYEVVFRRWHPLYWIQMFLSVAFGLAIQVDCPPTSDEA